MMLGALLSLRRYLAVSAGVALVIFLTQILFGATLVTALTTFNRQSRAVLAPAIADVITEPIKAVVAPNNPLGAIAGGLLWPLLAVWVLLLLASVFFVVIGRGLGTAGRAISS